MYVKKNSSGRYAISELREDQLETILRALKAYRAGMIQSGLPTGFKPLSETRTQYERAGLILRRIEDRSEAKGTHD